MPSIWTLGSTLPLEPKILKVKCQAFPHDGSTGLKGLLQPAHLDNHYGAGAKGLQMYMAGRSEDLLVDTGATYSVLTSYSGVFSSQICTMLGAAGKPLPKDSHEHFSVAGKDRYFPTSFWWSLSSTPLLRRNISLPLKSCNH